MAAGHGLNWIKSSWSGGNNGGGCVEVAAIGARRAVRDSKDPHGPMITLDGASWQSFLDAVKQGQVS